MKLLKFVVIGIVLLLALFSCKKLVCDARTDYFFEMKITASPNLDSIRIGDTLFLDIENSTTLLDFISNEMIDYSGAINLGTYISVIQITGIGRFSNAANNFEYINFKAIPTKVIDETFERSYFFVEKNNIYQFRIGLIPKVKGTYRISISGPSSVSRKQDKCTRAAFEISFHNTDQHLYLNKILAPDVDLPPGGGVYLFNVY